MPAPNQAAGSSSLDNQTGDTHTSSGEVASASPEGHLAGAGGGSGDRTTTHSSSTGGSALSGAASTGAGGARALSSASSGPDVVCPEHVPDAGERCKTGLECSYDESTGDCERSARSSCVDDLWVVELPLGCSRPDDADVSCDIAGTWDLDYTEPNNELMGVPGPSKYVLKRDVPGQYRVVLPQTTDLWFTSWSFGAKGKCEINATSAFAKVIPPADGSKCGQFNTNCKLKLSFSGDRAEGTLSCSGNRRTCSSSLYSWMIDVTAARILP